MIRQIKLTNYVEDPGDVKDGQDPESSPLRTSEMIGELARKVHELIDTVNQLEGEIRQLRTPNPTSLRYR